MKHRSTTTVLKIEQPSHFRFRSCDNDSATFAPTLCIACKLVLVMNIAKYTNHVALNNNQSRMDSSTYVINVCLKNVIFLSIARYTETNLM